RVAAQRPPHAAPRRPATDDRRRLEGRRPPPRRDRRLAVALAAVRERVRSVWFACAGRSRQRPRRRAARRDGRADAGVHARDPAVLADRSRRGRRGRAGRRGRHRAGRRRRGPAPGRAARAGRVPAAGRGGRVTGDVELAIAGGGIAGLTAGLTAARLGRRTLVLTGGVPGGLLLSIERIDGYPGFPDGVPGYELCPLAQEQAMAAGAEFSMDEVVGLEPDGERWRVATSSGEVLADAVVVATGARLRELGVPGEERLRGRGVSHCASCDAPLLGGKRVAVVGGGDSACQEALTLADSVGELVLLQRGSELSAQAAYREPVQVDRKISIHDGVEVEEILGDDRVAGVHTTRGELEVDAVFVYVGLEPNDELLRAAGGRPGVFAAGIVRPGATGRAAAAAGEGAAAALAAHHYLEEGSWKEAELHARARVGT